MLIIGKAIKTHGLKGECKLECFCDSPSTLKNLKSVYIRNTVYEVEKITVSGAFVYIKIKNIDTVEEAKKLIGLEFSAEKQALPPLPEGRYYIADLVGCSVYADAEKLGTVKDVLQYGAADVLVMKKEGKEILFPWTEDIFTEVDTEAKKIIVNKPRFDEVAVYED